MEYHKEFEKLNARRHAVELQVEDMLMRARSRYKLDDIKAAIYHERSQRDISLIITMFDGDGDCPDNHEVANLVMATWNCFPHKALGGLSPEEMSLKHRK